jgi:hypothetical protein
MAQRRGGRRRGEILGFDVNRPLRRGNGVEVQGFHFAHLWIAVVRRLCTGDRHLDVPQIWHQTGGPRITPAPLPRLPPAAGGSLPTLPHEGCQVPCRLAVDRHLHVVYRWVGLAARVHPPWVVGAVFGGIPPLDGHVDPARESNGVVHHHDLLVVRRPARVHAVQGEVHATVGAPARVEAGERFAFERINDGEIPPQDVDPQPLTPGHQGVEEAAKLPLQLAVHLIGYEANAAVDIPTDDENGLLRPLGSGGEGGEVIGTVDQEGHPFGVRHAPAVPPPA